MAATVPNWHSYLQVIQSREDQRVQHFQKAENVLFIVLERVKTMDPRVIVDYSRNSEALEFSLSAAENEVTMEVPLCINSEVLLMQPCTDEHSNSENITNGDCQVPGSFYLGVPKQETNLENWTKEDVFSSVDDVNSRGHIVPGKVLHLLKELIVAAIVHCKHHNLIKPGELSAERLNEDGMQLPLLVSSDWKTICFNIIPVIRRKQDTLNNWQERGFPKGSLSKITQEAVFIPASYHHWRYSTNRPISKLVQILRTLKGYRLDSLCLLDQINHEYWKEKGEEKGLTFQHLKMILLWATHFFPSTEDWLSLEGSVYRLLVILLCCLVTKDLPHFLYPEQNLFNDSLDLTALYSKVETFAISPKYFLKFYFAQREGKKSHQKDNGLKALLYLPAENRDFWDTAFFDMLLSKFQAYQIKDTQRISAMSSILSKIKEMVHNES
ncbi:protein mab-21-like 4 isoform X2 [Erythrolamprus reginae]